MSHTCHFCQSLICTLCLKKGPTFKLSVMSYWFCCEFYTLSSSAKILKIDEDFTKLQRVLRHSVVMVEQKQTLNNNCILLTVQSHITAVSQCVCTAAGARLGGRRWWPSGSCRRRHIVHYHQQSIKPLWLGLLTTTSARDSSSRRTTASADHCRRDLRWLRELLCYLCAVLSSSSVTP